MDEIFEIPIPISDNVSLHPFLIDLVFGWAYPDLEQNLEITEKIITQIGEKYHDPNLTFRENLIQLHIKCYQTYWEMALEKGMEKYV